MVAGANPAARLVQDTKLGFKRFGKSERFKLRKVEKLRGIGEIMDYIKKDPFEEYIKNLPPTRKEMGQAWSAAIGLQDVDGLKPSKYLYETAKKNIEGEITIDEAGKLIKSYYESKEGRKEPDSEEADKVSQRIAKLLSEKAFVFSPAQYISIHRELFQGIFSHAGQLRDYNITKREWVLDGDTVSYGSAYDLRETLDYDFSQERQFRYNGLTMTETIHHLADFLSRLWQIHVFGEGNTRTTAVFLIKYLRQLGFDADNDMFAEHSWYFRNALVRANYNNLKKGVYETTEYLERFLRNLLMNEKNELHNRDMHISGLMTRKKDVDPIKKSVLTKREQQIINLLREDKRLTRAEMAEILNCSDATVKRALQSMGEKGVLRRIGSKKTGEWIIIE